MKKRRSPWMVLLAIFLCLLAFGLTTMMNIIRKEGIEGVFDRKRDAVKQVMPEAVPLVDRIEEQVRPDM
ncbi:MAG TPA: hypothetical protein VK934_01820 [Fimbriimonas sp.]|nr:hypothetical protein [Fimbriimonas sp.]